MAPDEFKNLGLVFNDDEKGQQQQDQGQAQGQGKAAGAEASSRTDKPK